MKQLIRRPIGQLLVLSTLVVSQFVFAGKPLKGDTDPGSVPINYSTMSLSIDSYFVVSDITIDIVGNDLMVNFNSPVGIATVSVYNSKSSLVYQTVVDTDNTSEVSMPTSFFETGTYTVTVTYGSTVYTEQINL